MMGTSGITRMRQRPQFGRMLRDKCPGLGPMPLAERQVCRLSVDGPVNCQCLVRRLRGGEHGRIGAQHPVDVDQ